MHPDDRITHQELISMIVYWQFSKKAKNRMNLAEIHSLIDAMFLGLERTELETLEIIEPRRLKPPDDDFDTVDDLEDFPL